MNKSILITIKKELRSILRDKKTIMRMLLFPLIIPAMIVLYGTMYDSEEAPNETEYKIGINYELKEVENELLKNLNITAKQYNSDDLEKEYKEENIDGYIEYKEENNEYIIYTDSSTASGMTLNALLAEYLEGYSNYLTNNYLLEHNINLEEAYNHFNVSYEDLSNTNYMVTILLVVAFTYIIMAICLATSSMATGVTATERENGTLETILTFPIKKTELIVGKYLSSVIVGFVASLVGLILTIVSILIGKNYYTMFEGFNLSLSLPSIIGSILVIASASFFIAGVALALTCFSKTYKEAQSAVSMLNMVCIVPMFVSILEVELTSTYYMIPICNFEQTLMDLFTNTASITNIVTTLVSTVIYIGIVLIYITKSYNSEKILFTK